VYVYRAVVAGVHDGDTITADVDLGWDIWRRATHIRLAGISARELSQPGGEEAAAHLAGVLPAGTELVVQSVKTGHDPATATSFERYVLACTLPDGRDLSQMLIAEGWAVAWDGRSKPTPYPYWPISAEGGT